MRERGMEEGRTGRRGGMQGEVDLLWQGNVWNLLMYN